MDRFRYKVIKKDGKTTWGWESAESSEELLKILRQKHAEPIVLYVEYEAPDDEEDVVSC